MLIPEGALRVVFSQEPGTYWTSDLRGGLLMMTVLSSHSET